MKKTILIIILSFLIKSLIAEDLDSNTYQESELISLDDLITLAESNSGKIPAISYQQLQIGEEIKMRKKSWMDHISLTASYNYGNGIVQDEINFSGVYGLNYSNRINTFLNVGLSMHLPLSRALSDKHKVKYHEMRVAELEYQKKSEVQLLHEKVIYHYNKLQFYLGEIKIQSEVLETNKTDLNYSESSFEKGFLELSEYRRSLDIYYQTRSKFELAYREAEFHKEILQDLAGTKIFK